MNRRNFVKSAAALAPMFVPRHALSQAGRPGANDRINVGLIGFGGRARFLMQYIGSEVPEAELVAVADCYLPRTNGIDPGGRPTALSDQASKWSKYQYFQKMFEKEKTRRRFYRDHLPRPCVVRDSRAPGGFGRVR